MAALPTPGGSSGTWGTELNDYLSVEHAADGTHTVKLDDLAAPDDNTDLNASSTKHGLLPKLSNVSTEYLDGTGVFSTPASDGPKMGAPSDSGAAYVPAYIANANAGNQVQDRLYAVRIPLRSGTLDRIFAHHWTAATAGETFRLGIYSPTSAGLPGALLLDAGTIDLSTATGLKALTISQAISSSYYWLAGVQQGGTAAGMLAFGAGQQLGGFGSGQFQRLLDITAIYNNNAAYPYLSSVTGALPDPFGTPTGFVADANTPIIGVRYA